MKILSLLAALFLCCAVSATPALAQGCGPPMVPCGGAATQTFPAVTTALVDSTIRTGSTGTTSTISGLVVTPGAVNCVFFSVTAAATIRSAVLGGSPAIPSVGSTVNGAYIACAMISSGTTASLVLTLSTSAHGTSDGVVAVSNADGANYSFAINAPSSGSGTIAVPANGAVIAYSGGASAGTWTGATQLLAYNANGDTIAALNSSSAVDSRTVSYSTGAVLVALAFSPVKTRTKLQSQSIFYVSSSGGDATGTGSSAAPWATIQNAINQLSKYYDLGGYGATISVGSGSFAGIGVRPQTGCAWVYILGNGAANTTMTASVADGIYSGGQNIASEAIAGCPYFFDQMTIDGSATTGIETIGVYANAILMGNPQVTGGGVTIKCNSSQWMVNLQNTGSTYQDSAQFGTMTLNCTGNPGYIKFAGGFASVESNYTITGSPVWSTAFVQGLLGGTLSGYHSTFSGAATGPTCVLQQSIVDTGGQGTSHFPGNVACSGGQLTLGATYN